MNGKRKREPNMALNPITTVAPYRGMIRFEMQMLRAKQNADRSMTASPCTEETSGVPDSQAKKVTPTAPSRTPPILTAVHFSRLINGASKVTNTGLALKTTAAEAALSIITMATWNRVMPTLMPMIPFSANSP